MSSKATSGPPTAYEVALDQASAPPGPHAAAEPGADDDRPRAGLGGFLARVEWTVPITRVLIFVAVIGLWELVVTQQWLPSTLDKTPLQTWRFLVDGFQSGEIPAAMGATLTAVVIAFALASVIGIPLGISLALLPRVERAMSPLLDAINATPRMVLSPLFVVIFGITIDSKVALGFAMCFFFIFLSARTGAQSADPEVVWLSTALGASKPQIFTKVLMPAALPSIFAGLRMTLIFAFHGVTASELLASNSGLGYLVQKYSNQFRMEGTYAIVVVIIVIATLLNEIMRIVERRVIRWTAPVSAQ